MRNVTTKEWTAALRSGAYLQGPSALMNPKQGTYCCLGVLADMAGVPKERGDTNIVFEFGDGCKWSSYPPDNWMGVDGETISDLIGMNDEGRPFSEIADWIEANDIRLAGDMQ